MYTFKTKSETLKMLESVLKVGKILPQYSFTVREFERFPSKVADEVIRHLGDVRYIVRSSSLHEDSADESLAGKFLSVPNVRAENLINSIEKVADSFGGNGEDIIFIQPMLTDVMLSGVVFTVCPNTCGNYYVINYDDETNSTSSVTSGGGVMLKTFYQFKNAKCENEKLAPIIQAARELEGLFANPAIDIEFAVDRGGGVYILQVRPLILKSKIVDIEKQTAILKRIHDKISLNLESKPYLYGKRTIYGIMPDWNPAEIIGIRPKPLALSLYKRLVTDGTWAYQRNNYGYKNLRSFPLIIDFAGMPYIDARVSFNSFIPKDIDENLSAKLADYYLDSLENQPSKHDKVEFDIIFSCYTFDLPERIKILENYGFSTDQRDTLKKSLLKLTDNIINTKDGLWISDTNRIEILKQRRKEIISSGLDTVSKIYWLLEDCSRYGTLPFAGLARAGFIAVQLLKSMISIGIISQTDYENYMRELNTVSSEMAADKAFLSHEGFIKKYGHLRPGTYDKNSPRYDDAHELYFGGQATGEASNEKEPFSLTLKQYQAIEDEMQRHGYSDNALSLFKFIKAGIEGREYSKFIFSKNLSDAIELIARLGEDYGYTKEEMSYMDVSVINKLYSSADDVKDTLCASIESGKLKYSHALSLTLPPVILSGEDIYGFFQPVDTPNFITMKSVEGDIVALERPGIDINNKVLLVRSADPGYDWIFSHNILGFITAYGGVNSHMAIRAGELSIPAVIGAGEKLFTEYSKAKRLKIDC
ncbi:MAG: PEP-utilizing enzyme, partial [Oscillospiraceae bacterium]|nr:PEP-utilizing enzyme [Oscillospiraceae bacterium]